MVLLVPFQSKYISVFHPVSPGLHMETPGKVDGDHLHAESNPGDGRNLMADFNQERGEKMWNFGLKIENITSWTPKPCWTLQVERPTTHGDTGGNPDRESKLNEEVAQLRAQVKALEQEASGLRIERDNLSAEVANLKVDVGPEPPTTQEGNNALELTDEAARKRLWRLCKRGTDGFLRVKQIVDGYDSKYMTLGISGGHSVWNIP